MKHLSTAITDFFLAKKIGEAENRDAYIYGLDLIISDIINFALIIILGGIFNRPADALVFLFVFCSLRKYCGGYHSRKQYICRISFIGVFVSVLLANLCFEGSALTITALNILSFLGLYKWSPVENQNKALSESKKSKNRKKSLIYSAFLILASYALYCLKSREGFIISLTMFIVALLLPIGIAVNKAVVIKNGKEEPQCLLSYKEQSFH